jgi:hypothetical protein
MLLPVDMLRTTNSEISLFIMKINIIGNIPSLYGDVFT